MSADDQGVLLQRLSSVRSVALVLMLCIIVLDIIRAQSCNQSTSTSFASKTAYRNAVKTFTSLRPVSHPGCEAIQVYLLARHGTRYPGASDVEDMIKKVPRLQDLIVNSSQSKLGDVCIQDVEKIKNWKLEINGSLINKLTEEGHKELIGIGERLQTRFPSLFVKNYSPTRYKFVSTDTPRARDSAKAFAKGLFHTDQGIQYETDNHLLRFYKSCNKWEKEVDDNESALEEYYIFTESEKVLEMMESISRRLGLAEKISFNDAWILYEMCRFETAWNLQSTRSPWCNLFSDSDLDILEYAEDLRYYWKDGYGHSINYEQACPIIKDITDNFNRTALEGTQSAEDMNSSVAPPPVGLFHFSHSGMLLKVYARLGLFSNQKPLFANESRFNNRERQWKTSHIDPFAANLMFVLFRCGNNDELKVATYVQEQEVVLTNCTSTLCPLSLFMETYGTIAEECNLEAICNMRHNAAPGYVSVGLFTLLFILLTLGVTFT